MSVTDAAAPRPGISLWWDRIGVRDRRALAVLAGAAASALLVIMLLLAAPLPWQPWLAGSCLLLLGVFAGVWLVDGPTPLPASRLLPPPETANGRPDRGWVQYKALSLSLRAAAGLAGMALLVVPFWGVDPRVHLWLVVPLLLLLPATTLHARTYPLRRHDGGASPARRAAAMVFLGSAGFAAVVAIAASVSRAPLLFVAPMVLASVQTGVVGFLVLSRPPSLRDLWYDDAVLWPGRPALTRPHTVGVPTLAAVAVAAAILAVAVVVHTGAQLVLDMPMVALALLMLMGAVAAGSACGVLVGRPDEPVPWRVRAPAALAHTRLVLGTCLTLASIVAVLAVIIAIGDGPLAPDRWVDAVALAVLVATGPYGFLVARRARQSRLLEERFPDFLRDLASGRQAGLTLEAAVAMATRGDYGALTPEIRRMAEQLTWNLSFEEALGRFADRVRTPLVARAVSLITEANRSGGHVAAVLQAAAEDARHRKEVQDARGAHMRVYMGIVYIGFLVFLAVAAVLYATLVPRLVEVSAAFSEDTPQMGAFAVTRGVQLSDYRTFYFVAALAQAVGNGLFAGLLGTGRLLAGLQHVFLMSGAAALVFLLFGAP